MLAATSDGPRRALPPLGTWRHQPGEQRPPHVYPTEMMKNVDMSGLVLQAINA